MSDETKTEEELSNKDGSTITCQKSKGISYLTYLEVKSEIKEEGSELNLNQERKWFGLKKFSSEINIPFSSIVNVIIARRISFWDLVFAILFVYAAIATQSIIWLALSALFIFTGYGIDLIIERENAKDLVIPSAGFGAPTMELKSMIQSVSARNATVKENVGDEVSIKTELLPFQRLLKNKQVNVAVGLFKSINQIVVGVALIAIPLILLFGFGLPDYKTSLENRVRDEIETQVLEIMDQQGRSTLGQKIGDVDLFEQGDGVFTGTMEILDHDGQVIDRRNVYVITDGDTFEWQVQ